MSKGRKRTPEHLKVVRGTDRADRRNEAAPKPDRGRPSAPSRLSAVGREMWGYVVKLTDDAGVLTELDALAVEQLVEAYSDWREARDIVDAEGTHYETENANGGKMIRAHPAVAMRSDAARRFQSLMAEFGLTPASRSKVNTKGDDGKEDPAAAYF